MTIQTTRLGLHGLAVLAISFSVVAQDPGPLTAAQLQELPQIRGARGVQQRHYFFDAAGPAYRLYVPRSYDPNVGAPLIVALHDDRDSRPTVGTARP